jgi:hypothetical protein
VRASLASGDAGLAIFYDYLAAARAGDVDRATALALLDSSVEAVASVRMEPSLYAASREWPGRWHIFADDSPI